MVRFSKILWVRYFLLVTVVLFVANFTVQAQKVVKKDTTIILLNDLTVQLQCAQALNDLYNFKFDRAENGFHSLRAQYRWHPLPYFLMGLIEWWKIMPNTRDTSNDKKFLAYMDSTINIAENLYDHYPEYKIEAAFYL